MIRASELRNIMGNYYGTEHYYRLFPKINFVYTDGVKGFSQNARAYWFVIEVFGLVRNLPKDVLYEVNLLQKI